MRKILYLCIIFWIASACSDTGAGIADVTLEVRQFVEQEVFTLGKEQGIYLWSAKKWADSKVSHIEYVLDSAVLNEYNRQENLNLKMLPTSCYHVDQSVFQVSDVEKFARFKVMCSPEKILENGGSIGGMEYALAYRIIVNGEPVEDRYGSVIVGIRVQHPYFSLFTEIDSVKVDNKISSVDIPIDVSVNFDNIWWVNLNFTIDENDVIAYNQLHGTDYLSLEKDRVTWKEDEAVLEKGKNNGRVVMVVETSDLLEEKYLLPIRLASVSENLLMIDPENAVRYVVFDKEPPRWMIESCATWRGSPDFMIDGAVNPDSQWICDVAPEYYVTVFLRSSKNTFEFSGIDIYGLQGNPGMENRGQKSGDILVSMDGKSWNTVMKDYQFMQENNHFYQGKQSVSFTPTVGRYIKILVTDQYDDYVGFSEITPIGRVIKAQ